MARSCWARYLGWNNLEVLQMLCFTLLFPATRAGGGAGFLRCMGILTIEVDVGGIVSILQVDGRMVRQIGRQRNNDQGNQIAFVCGMREDFVRAYVHGLGQPGDASASPIVGIGVDSITTFSEFSRSNDCSGWYIWFSFWNTYCYIFLAIQYGRLMRDVMQAGTPVRISLAP